MTEAAVGIAAAGWRRASPSVADAAIWIAVFASIAGLGAASGGFFAPSWGWSTLGLLWLALVALVLRNVRRLSRSELVFLGALACLAGWIWLSLLWSRAPADTVLEGERALVSLAAAAAVLFTAGSRATRLVAVGMLPAIAALCGWALTTRLFPDRIDTYDASVYRLSTPIGYWNGLGLLAVMGILLALGLATRCDRRSARVLAAASLPLLVLTLYFTFSRGSWISLGAGGVVLLLLDRNRLQLALSALGLLALPALALLLASKSEALTHPHAPLAQAAHEGRRLALALLALIAAQAVLTILLDIAARRVAFSRLQHRIFSGALLLVAVVASAALVDRHGGPATIARSAYADFKAPPPAASDLNERLFNLSGNGRWPVWRVAWQQAQASPWLGDGAGTFGRYWLEERATPLTVKDAHNLYLETLAELGPLGLVLVLAVLTLPLAAAVRARGHPLVPATAAVVAAYALHAAADWDWELAGVTLAAVLAGCACVTAGRELPTASRRPMSTASRIALAAVLVALTPVALVGLLGNSAAAASESAMRAGRWADAERHARRAIRWAPWSAIGWRDLGEAQLAQRRFGPARRSLLTAVARDSGDWLLWFDLAAASHGTEADVALRRARLLNPLSPDVAQPPGQSGAGA